MSASFDRVMRIWLLLICLVIGTWLWWGVIESVSPGLADLLGPDTVKQVLFAFTCGSGLFAAQLWAAAFSGPVRASVGELSWTTTKPRAVAHGLQLSIFAMVLALLLGTITLSVLLACGWALPSVVLVLTAFGLCALLATPLAMVLQRFALDRYSRALPSTIVLGALVGLMALAAGVNSATSLALSVGCAAGSWLIVLFLAARSTVTAPQYCEQIPRGSLVRANANVDGFLMTVTSLEGSASRTVTDAAAKARRGRIRLPKMPAAMRLLTTSVVRMGARWWKTIAGAALLSIAAGALAGTSVGQGLSLGAGIVVALLVSRTWTEWVSSPGLSRMFFHASRRAGAMIFLAGAFWPWLTAMVPLLAVGTPLQDVPQWALLSLLLVVVVPLDRARASLSSDVHGQLGAMIHLPDIGLVPMGIIDKASSGWLLPGIAAIVAAGVGPSTPTVIAALFLALTALRFARIYRTATSKLVTSSLEGH